MPVQNKIKNFKCFNQLRNGDDFSLNTSDFTTALIGNAGEKVKIEFEQTLSISTQANIADEWSYADNVLTRTLGSFITDGFQAGQVVDLWLDYSTSLNIPPAAPDFAGLVIDSISADGSTIFFTTQLTTTFTTTTTAGFNVDFSTPANVLSSLVYSFGLVDNADSYDNISLLTQDSQSFQAANISGVTTLDAKGNFKSWQSGDVTVESLSVGVEQTFKVSHEFVILPYYVVNELTNLQNNQSIDLFDGDNTLKYVFRTQFRRGLANVSSEIGLTEDRLLGSTGWFNENFDGGVNNYSVSSITYNSGTPLDLAASNDVVITIEKSNGNFNSGDYIGLYHSFLPQDESVYTQNQNTFQQNFNYDYIRVTLGGSNTGTGIFKSVNAIFSGSTATITATLEYTTAEQTKLNNNDYYLLSLQVEDSSLTALTSDRVNLIADVNQYLQDQSNAVTGFAAFSKFNILNHSEALGVDPGATTSTNWNEDGIVLDFAFSLDLNKSTVLNSLNFNLVATDGNNSFLLDSVPLNFSGVVNNQGVQEINIDSTRGYNLPSTGTGAQFNNVKINTGTLAAGQQEYTGSFGQKIRWQDWIQNPEVAGVFYDNNELNNNLNFKSSNYSNLNGYEIKLVAELDLTGVDALGKTVNTTFTQETGNISVFDYDVTDNGDISAATIELFDSSGTNPTDFILGSQDTLMRVTWSDATPFDVGDIIYIIHRLEPYRSLGNDIQESSSLYGVSDNTIILPITSITKSGSTFISESLIDYTQLNPNLCYKLSSRIQVSNPIILGFEDYECETIPTVSLPPENPTITPPPPIVEESPPAFCGINITASGSAGISQYGYRINYTGFVGVIFEPQVVTDMLNIGKLDSNGVDVTYLATSHMVNTDPSLDIYVNAGLVDGGADINNVGWDNNITKNRLQRFLAGNAQGAGSASFGSDAVIQYIGAIRNTYPDRVAEYRAATGDNTTELNLSSGQQVIWMPVDVNDTAVFMASGAAGTQWEIVKVFCYQTS